MKLPRILTAAVAATTLCVAGTLAVGGQAAYAADNNPIQIIFFDRELLAFQCGLHGGTFYDAGSGGYGCHMADGGEIYCQAGSCTWTPARRAIRPITVVTHVGMLAQLQPVNPFPVATTAPIRSLQRAAS